MEHPRVIGPAGRASQFGQHLLSIDELGRERIVELLHLAEVFSSAPTGPVPQSVALLGRTVANAFFESSTRTRLSFEMAARRLGADVITLDAMSSSVTKGESLRDTVETIESLGVDAVVLRHPSSGAAVQASRWVDSASILNAGDGQHEHPTQALVDLFTIKEALAGRSDPREDLSGLRIGIVGDVRHSRVARSDVAAFSLFGAEVTLVGPEPFLPVSTEGWPIHAVVSDLDAVIGDLDVCYLLRIQLERLEHDESVDLATYRDRFGLTAERCRRLAKDAFVMHPGPMNRGVEIDSEVTEFQGALMRQQVRNGVPVRMAAFYRLLGGSGASGVEEWR